MSVSTLSSDRTTIRALRDELCAEFTLDELQRLYRELLQTRPPTKKLDNAEDIAAFLSDPQLRSLLDKLDTVEMQALSEALHSPHGYSPERFKATYGAIPYLGGRSDYRSAPKLLRVLFSYDLRVGGYQVRTALRKQLLPIVPAPKQPDIESVANLPVFYEHKTERYEWQPDDAGATVIMRKSVYRVPTKQPKTHVEISQIPIETSERTEAAQRELWSILKLVREGKISVAEKSSQPSPDIMSTVAKAIGGDFYQSRPLDEFKEISFMRSFAWPMLIQSAHLASASGSKKLSLTKAGIAALSVDPALLIKSIWTSWLGTSSFDEFRRIDSIKGQTGKAKHSMSDPPHRREQIVKTLAACPASKWIRFDEFSRYMRALGNNFQVSYDPWRLYIGEPNYGSLGYSGSSSWDIMEERYMMCFLFEYAATLGIIDIAFIEPEFGHKNYASLWGTDHLQFLSRYDGLLYFRITSLGEYCLGKTASYIRTNAQSDVGIAVKPSLRIELIRGTLELSDSIILESFADSIGEGVWELSQEKSIIACENGHTVDDLRNVLESLDDQPLPQQVENYLTKIRSRFDSVRRFGTAIVFECRNSTEAKEIASHSLTKKLCQLTSFDQLVVMTANEEKFHKALRILGYGTGTCS